VRRFLLLVVLAFLAVTRASAQSEVSVAVRLYPDTSVGPHPVVRVISLLDDPDWVGAVTNSYPVRLQWTVQLWQKGGLFEKAGPKVEWRDVIQRKSLMGIYEVTTFLPGQRAATQQFASLDILALYIGKPFVLDDFGPRSSGNWYYRVTLTLSTLTSDEIDKQLSASEQRGDPTGEVQRAFNKFLMNFSLPKATRRSESPAFRWR
jgi:hypothetical protein